MPFSKESDLIFSIILVVPFISWFLQIDKHFVIEKAVIPLNSYIHCPTKISSNVLRVSVLNPTVSSITETTQWEIVREKSISEKRTNWNSAVGLISQPVTEYTDENQLVGRPGFPASPRTTSVPISRMFVSILGRGKPLEIRAPWVTPGACVRLIFVSSPFRPRVARITF